MNWLEVGCPHCPSIVTFPRAAAGRTVRCPECEKSYLVPTPSENGLPLPVAPRETASSYGVEGSAVDEDFAEAPADEPATIDLPPTISATDAAEVAKATPPHVPTTAAVAPSPPPQPLPKSQPAANGEPEAALDSPLPEVPILDPPRAPTAAPSAAAVNRPKAPPVNEPTASIAAPPVPLGRQAAGLRESVEEAQARIHRAELRARVNLMVFAIGITVMIVFAYIVIHIARRS